MHNIPNGLVVISKVVDFSTDTSVATPFRPCHWWLEQKLAKVAWDSDPENLVLSLPRHKVLDRPGILGLGERRGCLWATELWEKSVKH